jgi:predicted CXXCH cytochrome family protein
VVGRIALLALLVAVGAGAWKARSSWSETATPRDLHGVAFVGSDACGGCHADNHRSWKRTFHRTMTAEATPASVLGAFDGATLKHDGVTARMDRDGDAYRMTFKRGDGAERVVRVQRTVGSHRYQQYLAKEGDTYWRLPVAWHVEERRWFPMTGAFLFSDEARIEAPGRPVFGGGVFDRHVTRWNDNCVFCHNVAPNPGLERATGRFDTTTAELGIACESCHGPGAAHVAANGDPLRRWFLRARGAADPTIVNPARLSPPRAADVCGRCHGQRIADDVAPFLTRGDPFVPGDDLALTTSPLWRDTSLAGDRTAFAARFWGDGTPRLTAYEYQGLLQSRCAQEGTLTCTTCHGMHEGDPRGQLRAGLRGAAADQMCTRCHAAYADRGAAARHSRHDVDGAGARCVACHMPRVVYGVLDTHRSHRIEIPDPKRAARDGRPDACSSCHVTHPGGPMETAFAGDPVTRALAVDALGRAQVPLTPDERALRAGALLDVMGHDDYPAVRHLAWRGLGRLGVESDFNPSASAQARATTIQQLRARLGSSAVPLPHDRLAALRARASSEGIEIGE